MARTVFGQAPVLPGTIGTSIDLGTATSSAAGWADIIGHVNPKATGAGTPTRTTYRGNIKDFAFIVNDEVDFSFHIPHDYLPASDLYFHTHWSHNGTNVSGSFVLQIYASYAKGHNQANFPAEIAPTVTYATVDLATTPQYRHRIDEIQLSASSPTATQLDSDDIEVDGIILMTCKPTTIPTITGGSLFIHFTDLHYRTTNVQGTVNKAPNFYAT